MKSGKILINLLLSIIVGILLIFSFAIISPTSKDIIKGYIDDSSIDSKKKYVESTINRYDGEPSWYPTTENNTYSQPQIAGQAGLLVEINSGDVLFEKNSSERRPIASLVKIMTAVIALEHMGLEDKVYITQEIADIGENSMQLSKGEIYNLEELLYGLILHSGNDAAYAIAEGVAGNSDRFIDWMNIKAGELGMLDTHFSDPSGLDDTTFSTPTDLVKLTRYALKNPEFRKISGTLEKEIFNGNNTHKYMYLYNQTNLLSTYPGVAGIKTGFTEEAGLSLVTYSSNEGKEVVGVVLNSIDRKGDMILMLDHGFESLGIHIEHNLL
ncbi:D-alanyl-D-alanine carboxypeptidase [candidate division WWE3 bacterium]|jgi:serine-type D-Ala-D-Ala carboxypeptidase (penicillin-binding protein 5/6)|nr:D-alanyl-D-alanine carboxypeptidase [candidate division WWE3 bacterium]MBT7350344.1 D-alanyl-D-alanine carboxypeptidase [candidate division WWE3 bacterium]